MQAKKKESFILYLQQKELFNKLTDEQAGKVIKAIYEYEDSGKTPNFDFGLDIVFTSIKTSLDSNRIKYQEKCEKNRENINKRWNKNTNVYNSIPTYTNYTDNDNDTYYDKDNDSSSHSHIDNNINILDENKIIDDDDNEYFTTLTNTNDDLYKFFKENFNQNKPLTKYQTSIIDQFRVGIDENLVLHAMKICVDHNACNFKYLKSVIQKWKKNNVKTIEDAEKIEEEFQKNKQEMNLRKPRKVFSFQQSDNYSESELDALFDN